MGKKQTKTLTLSVAALTLVLMATACSSNNNQSLSSPATPTITASAEPSPSPDEVQNGEEGDNANNPSDNAKVKTGTGQYVGLADNNSLEIDTPDGPIVYRINSEIADLVDPWDSGISVTYEYTEQEIDVDGSKVKQYIIQSINQQ
ncbi:MAG: hypothetical protein P0Y55_03135 [Candidatus Cohnella colombiensis]|uniref:Uncharacterized protein n=1 Tax=Candidatus Cohnella colombiensis TaxID=3121368 RepID=A0AA95EY87_9BACL|nr:MAG: hypothetical protein P0Y55_03135 [Cohnella sp.]